MRSFDQSNADEVLEEIISTASIEGVDKSWALARIRVIARKYFELKEKHEKVGVK